MITFLATLAVWSIIIIVWYNNVKRKNHEG